MGQLAQEKIAIIKENIVVPLRPFRVARSRSEAPGQTNPVPVG